MRMLAPIAVPMFGIVEPELTICHAAWSTSFEVGPHIYSMRFEAYTDGNDCEAFCAEQGITGDGAIYVLKFDNSINDLEPGSAFNRLQGADRLTVPQLYRLADCLAGGLIQFVNRYQPKVIVAFPNDSALESWYRALLKRFTLNGHLLDLRSSAYYERHPILLIYRM